MGLTRRTDRVACLCPSEVRGATVGIFFGAVAALTSCVAPAAAPSSSTCPTFTEPAAGLRAGFDAPADLRGEMVATLAAVGALGAAAAGLERDVTVACETLERDLGGAPARAEAFEPSPDAALCTPAIVRGVRGAR